jgi:hypothetical protein
MPADRRHGRDTGRRSLRIGGAYRQSRCRLAPVKWVVEYSMDLAGPTWEPEDTIKAGGTFQDFEDRFVQASDGVPAAGYYRIHIHGALGSTNTYVWGPEGRLLLV